MSEKKSIEKYYVEVIDKLPSRKEWYSKRVRNYVVRQVRFTLLLFTSGVIWVAFFFTISSHISALNLVQKLNSQRALVLGEKITVNDSCIFMNCAYLCPVELGGGWKQLHSLPYGSLVSLSSIFSPGVEIESFQECHTAYWTGVSSEKREFKRGYYFFRGAKPNVPSCPDLHNVGKKPDIKDTDLSTCLSVDILYNSESSELRPVIVHVGHRDLLYQNPGHISMQMAENLKAVFLNVRTRIGVFGFSQFDQDDRDKNVGVLDLLLALKWVRRYIKKFNGDPNSVTLVGWKSGATISLALYMSKYYEEFKE